MRGEWYAIIGMALLGLGGFPLTLITLGRIARRVRENGGRALRAELIVVLGLLLMSVVLLPLCCVVTGYEQFWILEAPIKLAVGWIAYLDRAERSVQPDAMPVVSAIVCLAATAIVAHLVLRWLAASAARPW